MIGLGTFVNMAAIFIGSLLGVRIKNHLQERYRDIMMAAVGLTTLVIGISGALTGIYRIENGSLKESYLIELIIFLVLGSVIGTVLQISERLDCFGERLESKFATKKGQFSQGFVTASLIFCVGAMAIMGSIEDGMNHNYTLLFAKSILDGITSLVLASTLGVGVMFSLFTVGIYQFTLTFIASLAGDFLPGEAKLLMGIVGSVLIMGIGFNLLEIKKINIGNMLPSIFLPIIYVFIKMLF